MEHFLSFIEVTGRVTGHAICRDGAISDGFNLHSVHGASQQNLYLGTFTVTPL